MSSKSIFILILGALFLGNLQAQQLTLSPYSRYAIGEIRDFASARNVGMGGIGVATDNFFSINQVNPASLADIVYTTLDISAFGQFNSFRTENGARNPFTAGFQNLSFAFPSNKGPVVAFGFAPYSSVGYDISENTTFQPVKGDTTSYIQRVNIEGEGGLNQVFLGAAFKMAQKRLRLGVTGRYLFGNTLYKWNYALLESDSSLLSGSDPLTIVRDVYIKGFSGQAGLMWVDTLDRTKGRYYRIGLNADYSLNLNGDRYLGLGNTSGTSTDTVRSLEVGDIQVPLKIGAGFMVHQIGKWSYGADFTYQDWSQLRYFTDTVSLGPEWRVGLGGEWIPNFAGFKYWERVAIRFGAFYKQTYINFEDVTLNDYGVTFGFGLPAGRKGNSRFNRGRSTSRINMSFVLGRRGSLASGLPVEEYYGHIRLGFNLNERWFVRRVVD
ncbi:MAG: hypothetical protein AAFY71_06500 [Bacteroidota bacterium]